MLRTPLNVVRCAAILALGTNPLHALQQDAPQQREAPPVTDPRPLSFHDLQWNHGSDTSWQRWWALERERHLQIRRSVRRGAAEVEGTLFGSAWASRIEDAQAPTRAQKEYLILPGLQSLNEDLHDLDVQAETLFAIARIGVDVREAVHRIRPHLRAPSRDLARTAVLALGMVQHREAQEELTAILTDAAHGRWLTGTDTAVPTDLRAWAALASASGSHGLDVTDRDALVADLLRVLGDPNTDIDLRSACVVALGSTPGSDASAQAEPLFALLADTASPALIRAQIPGALARLAAHGDAELQSRVRDELVAATEPQHDSGVRAGALLAMGSMPHERAEERAVLQDLLADHTVHARTPMERHLACLALGRLAGRDANVQRADAAAEVLLARLDAASIELRAWACLGSGVLISSQADTWQSVARFALEGKLLETLTHGRDEETRSASAIALALAGQQRAAGPLMTICSREDHPQLRGHAATALGMLGHAPAEALLLDQLERASHLPSLLERTAIGLALLRSDRGHARLLNMLAPNDGQLPTYAETAAAARALGITGNARTAPFLLTALDNRRLTPKARAMAARALGRIADQDAEPWHLRLTPTLNHTLVTTSVLDWESGNGVLDRR